MSEGSKLNLQRDPIEGTGVPPTVDDFVINYFNYFTEIEEHFVRRRGKHMLVSALDWAMIESWKDLGIPLHIVLRAIDCVFDAYDAQPKKTKFINSILYCQQEVMACFEEYALSRVGARGEPSAEERERGSTAPPFSKEVVIEYLDRSQRDLKRVIEKFNEPRFAKLREAIERATQRLETLLVDAQTAGQLNLESLEPELTRLEAIVYESLLECIPDEELERVRKEGAKQLKEYKKRMEKGIYEQTLANYVGKRLREEYGIPRFSLFYL